MTYDDRVYGHPGQVQPAHLVITSPHYDSRENASGDPRDVKRGQMRFEDAPVDEIVRLRESGLSFQKIAERLGLPHTSVFEWYKRAKEKAVTTNGTLVGWK